MRFTFVRAAGAKGAFDSPMRKRDLLKALSDPDLAASHQRAARQGGFFS